ncbi:hypothetical protein ILUMI_08343 [Ignelater luminosus]|uniref:Uncharacterized protein n=1 Tax=Ignelater luminosus TaxID=2038154 RepID=A0A8K0D7S3_IGNLU|nr:hypothetical protein ILUMI_08343 [Ignelater luminosus]
MEVRQEGEECVSGRHVYDYTYGEQWECTEYNNLVLYSYILCKDLYLEAKEKINIAIKQENNFKYIIFEDSVIPTVHAGTFASYAKVEEIYLNSSEIRTLEPAAFGGITNLKILHLEDNNITEIVRGTLNSLTNLEKLYLSKNDLYVIEDNSLQGLLVLDELDLSKNNLNNLTAHTVSSLNTLRYLSISFNSLQNIDENAFLNTHKLERLLINNNNIKVIHQSTIKNLDKLKILDMSFNYIDIQNFSFLPNSLELVNLSNNNISYITDWSNLQNVQKINLEHNSIFKISSIGQDITHLNLGWNNLKNLSSSLFYPSNNMKRLRSCYNHIELTDIDSCKGLFNLKNLNFTHNSIEHLPIGYFKDLTSLKSLDLSYNNLRDLEFGTFAGLSNLEELHLEHNNLTDIHENSFYIFDNLKFLYLHNNEIKSINTFNLLSHLKSLEYVTIVNNNWTCNTLLHILMEFRDKKVKISDGNDFKVSNIQGISCINEKHLKRNHFLSRNNQSITVNSTNLKQPIENLNVQNSLCNTTFYKYFNEDFKNSTFYTFFSEEFIDYIEKDLNRSRLFKFLDEYVSNKCSTCQSNGSDNNNNILTYLNDDLQNTAFFKYFKQDFLVSDFFKFFNEGYRNTALYQELNRTTQINDPNNLKNSTSVKYALKSSNSESADVYLRDEIILTFIGIILISNQVNSEQCEVQEVKSSKGTYVRRYYEYRKRMYIGGTTEYPTLYKYVLCTNPKMETGKQIFIANAQDNYKYILFKNSTIPVVPAGIFTSLASISEAYLNGSQIKIIEPGAFNGMTKLEELHLENNNIKEIVRGTLNSLTHLKRLDISQNELKKIEDNSFHGLLILEELKLSRNHLTNITSLTFSSLNNLSYLDLSHNLLSVVDDNSLSIMNKLTQLILNNNLLTSILTVQNLQTLQLLELCYNKIEEIDFSLVPGMKKLNISFNEIKLVKDWSKMENTEIVDITHNIIPEIHAIGKGILQLSMKQNKLKVLDALLFNNSVDLFELDLGYNTITEISANTFRGLSKLSYLSLSNNNLKYLSIGIFKDLIQKFVTEADMELI